jgi:hypothetical protein
MAKYEVESELCLIKHYAMKTYVGVEIYIHALVALPPAEEQPVPRGQEVG